MRILSVALLIGVVGVLLYQGVDAQSVRTVNGSMYLEIPGATLVLQANQDSSSSNSQSSSSLASQADVTGAIQNVIAQMQPQINSAFMVINSSTARTDGLFASMSSALASATLSISTEENRALGIESSLALSVQAAGVRAIGIENSLALSVSAEGTRAMGMEASLALSVSAERARAISIESNLSTNIDSERNRATAAEIAETQRATNAENSLSSSLSQTQTVLSQTQSSLVQARTELAQSQSTMVSMQSATAQTVTSLVQQLASINNCSARGLLSDGTGRCVTPSGTSSGSGSSSGGSAVCSGSSSSLPICNPGYYPDSSTTPSCGADPVSFPTTFTCKAVTCPQFSSGANVPTGCRCLPGYSGTIIATNTTPFVIGACIPVSCPTPSSSGSNVASGCTCNPGYRGSSLIPTQVAPFYNGSCDLVSCPQFSTGGGVPAASGGCRCIAGYTGTIAPSTTGPDFYTGSCTPVPCPASSSGTPPVCSCYPGCTGTVTAMVGNPGPFYMSSCSCPVDFVALGAGGGGGGGDGPAGGSGGSGGIVYGSLPAVIVGNSWTIVVATGGGGGAGGATGTGAGSAGSNNFGQSGGSGGNAGSSGSSGGGGGGGGWSGIRLGGTDIAVAGGGGGGGGSNEDIQNEQAAGGGGSQPRGNMGVNNYVGQNGFSYSGDGGGGGGGGGGRWGGVGQAQGVSAGASGGGNYVVGSPTVVAGVFGTSTVSGNLGAGVSTSNVVPPNVSGKWWNFPAGAGEGGAGSAGGSTGNGGGQGTVIIRYYGPQRASGGSVTSDSQYTYHTFTSGGTFTITS